MALHVGTTFHALIAVSAVTRQVSRTELAAAEHSAVPSDHFLHRLGSFKAATAHTNTINSKV